jgi:uncharacterized protein
MHYLLFYEVNDDYAARRAGFRDAHLEKAWQSHERGELVLAGALANPLDGAVLLFQGESPKVAEEFAKTDPYVTNGLVKRWHVREWSTVVGERASTPIRPAGVSRENRALPQRQNARLLGQRGLILRMWRARSTLEKADAYIQHATQKVFPELCRVEGHRGACLLRRTIHDAVEFVVFTLWESMEAVSRFAGADTFKAIVESEARAVLKEYDDSVEHFEIADCTGTEHTRRA